MPSNIVEAGTTIALGIIGVATVAMLVSKNANTTGVIQAGASGFGNSLAVAEAPVTGAATNINLSYPGGGFSNEGALAGEGG